VSTMFELILGVTLFAILTLGMRQARSHPLERVDARLWPYLHH
jgi:hypothetical protein